MATINDYFEQARLSEAAYASNLTKDMFGGGNPGNPSAYAKELIKSGMSDTQAVDFSNKYKVVDQYTDPESGFSGTVFEDTSGKIFMTIRGTEPTAFTTDWPTNIADIGSDGIAIDQGIAMYNWYQRLITPVGSQAIQYIYHKEESILGVITKPASLEPTIVTITESGENEGGGLDGVTDFTVTGHSLGGHLAMIMSRIAPNLVTSTLTFNAPRFDTNLALDWSTIPFSHLTLSTTALTSEGFFDLLEDAEYRDSGSSQIGYEWATSKIVNTRIEGDVVSLIGDLPGAGDQVQLFAESINEGLIDAHLMPAITDALAVANLYAQVQPDLSLETITAILKASSNIAKDSLESAVTALGNIFVNGFSQRKGNEYDSDRDFLYKDIDDIKGDIPKDRSMSINTFITSAADGSDMSLSSSQIENMARSNIAYRYALVNLNPFAVIGANYTEFNKEGELDLYTSSTPDGQLTDTYLQDRANFMAQLIYEGINDTGYTDATIDNVVNPSLPNYYYLDVTTGRQALNAPYSSVNPSSGIDIQKDAYQQFIFGSNEGDPDIVGGFKDDHLYGMGGNDTLKGYGGNDYIEGGKGKDTMEGGAGNDTFFIMGKDTEYDVFNGGSGDEDTIQGSDRDDVIRVHKFVGENTVEIIDGGGGENIIAGTVSGDTIDLSGTELRYIKEIRGGGGEDTITGSAGNDHLYGGVEGDTLKGMGGDDTLYGLNDDLSDDNVMDRLEGGEGDDTYHIGAGDVISDVDGGGSIWFGGQLIASLSLLQQSANGNYYESSDDTYNAILNEDYSLTVFSSATNFSSFTIENYTESGFGINLEEYQSSPSLYDHTLTGTDGMDVVDIIGSQENGWWYYFTQLDGSTFGQTLFESNPTSTTTFKITGGLESDRLAGMFGSDHLIGNDGNDALWGIYKPEDAALDQSGDLLEGGAGKDILSGSGGEDILDGGEDMDFLTGLIGEDQLNGAGGNDILVGDSHTDVLSGGVGDDLLVGDGRLILPNADLEDIESLDISYTYSTEGYTTGYTTINFSIENNSIDAGNDILDGGAGRDFLLGGAGNDRLFGGTDHDLLIGNDGDDYLRGDSGNDWLIGDNEDFTGTGNDTLFGGIGDDVLYGLGGNDILYGQENDDTLFGHEGDDQLLGGAGDDRLQGNDGTDTLYGDAGNDYLWGGIGNDTLYGGSGNDRLYGDNGDNLNGTSGDTTPNGVDTLYGGAGNDQIFGENGVDILYGGTGDDVLLAGNGDDFLYGEEGDDDLDGGFGDDTYIFKNGDNIDLVSDSDGKDTIVFDENIEFEIRRASSSGSPRNLYYKTEGEDLVVRYGQDDLVIISDVWTARGISLQRDYTFQVGNSNYTINEFLESIPHYIENKSNDTTINGSQHDDRISGDTRDNIIYGYGGVDMISGYGGFDSTMMELLASSGFLGKNNITFSGIFETGSDLADFGNDKLYGMAGNDALAGGNGDDGLIGDIGDDVLYGGNGDDSLYGGEGWDVLSGGDGDDYLDAGAGNDQIFGGEGVDTLSFLNQGKGVNVSLETQRATLTNGDIDVFTSIENITGSESEDQIVGDVKDNLLRGRGGNDNLAGRGGNDILYGDAGNDYLTGDEGDDFLFGGAGSDRLDGGDGRDTADYSDSFYAFSNGVIVDLANGTGVGGYAEGDVLISIENIIGTLRSDSLFGDSNNNSLDGGAGADTLDGRAGHDIAVYENSTAGVVVNLSNGLGTGGYAEGDILTSIEGVYGSAYSDLLAGNQEDNMLYGNDGDDEFVSSKGADLLDGGGGQDTANYNNSEAGIVANLITGTVAEGDSECDTLFSIENIKGSDYADRVIGNVESNKLEGYNGDDNLQGREGDDTLYGGLGDDFLRGGEGADILDGGDGRDAIDYRDSAAGVTIDLAAGTVSGGSGDGDSLISIENGYGSDFDDSITGNDERNTLIGFIGNDELIGGGENDNLQGREGDDTLYGGFGDDFLRGGEGADILDGGDGRDAIDYRDSSAGVTIDLSAGTVSGGSGEGDIFISIENGYGSNFDDSITGNDERNTLIGFIGNDRLYGGGENDNLQGREGDDTLFGGQGDDFLRGGEGADIIDGGEGRDSSDYRDSTSAVAVDLSAGTASGGTAEGDTLLSIENVYGTEYNDSFVGSAEANTLLGYDGDDILSGNEGNDNLQGGDGQDELYGGLGNDVFRGGAGADIIDGGEGRDSSDYRDSTSAVAIDLSLAIASGGTAEGDTLLSIENVYGTQFNDTFVGNEDANTLLGYGGDDILSGNQGNDNLQGGDGQDELYGGLGNDSLCGGAGNDAFVFDTVLDQGGNIDTIVDFSIDEDTLTLSKSVFTSLVSDDGTLLTENFHASLTGTASDENDYLLYNTASGSLLYDADGSGSGVAVEFAKLTTKPGITANDFVIAA